MDRAATIERWRRAPLGELALLGVVALVNVGGTAAASTHQVPARPLDLGGWALLVTSVLLLPFRHRAPVAVLAGVFATTAAYWSLGYPGGPVFLPLIVALAAVLAVGRRKVAIASLVAGFAVFPWLPYLLGNGDRPTLGGVLALAAWLVALIAVIELVRSRRERAREEALIAAETVRRQAADERVRIARDLHDAVAHSMSLIYIQAGVALHLIDERPEQARDALATIKGASKDALVELRSILGVLRQVDEDASRAPTPSLGRIDDLVAQAALSGVDVRLDVDGDLTGLPLNVDLAAYRIVQESLTNVARHADRPDAVVRIHADGSTLAVEVLDEGTGAAAAGAELPSGGNGIAGMRERALSVGGRLTAGPRPGRGFAVRAELPIGSAP
jgi:signal transduction histidine kinase